MKKGLITLAVILALVMSMAIMAPAFAAEANDFECFIVSPRAKDVAVTWSGEREAKGATIMHSGAASLTVAEDGSAKFEGGASSIYVYVYPDTEAYNHITNENYPYICVSLKLIGADDDCYVVFGEGAQGDVPVGELTEYTKVIGALPDGYGLDVEFTEGGQEAQSNASRKLIKIADYTSGLSGVTAYVEYIGFFKTKADAEAFDYEEWLEDNAANIKGAESGSSGSSVPETSASESGTSESSKPSADTGHGTFVSAAAIIFAGAAAVVVLSKKR